MATPIGRDVERLRELEEILKDPATVLHMDNASVQAVIDGCIVRLRRLRMGGRSSSLVGLSVVLWNVHDRDPQLAIDVEDCLALAFRVALDPSYVQSEWAVVLAGVLIARYARRLSAASREEVIGQCRLLLRDLEGRRDLASPIRRAASALLEAWDTGFPDGLNPVVHSCLEEWPETAAVSAMPQEKLIEIVTTMNRSLPAWLSDRERRLYRLHLEREGRWGVLERVSLGISDPVG
jgi:hypothetical protein